MSAVLLKLLGNLTKIPIVSALALALLLTLILFAGASAESAPSALSRFVDGSGTPLPESELWLFCYGDDKGQNLLSQQWIHTNGAGAPDVPLPDPCPFVVALRPRYTQPSTKPGHGPAYWVFEANWQLTPEGLMPTAAEGDVTIKRPFILFNVVVSLEWKAASNEEISAQLQEGLAQASLYLADLSDGYMSFGPVQVVDGGQRWQGADIRIQSANDLAPAAYVGGIVPAALSYRTGVVEPTFKPAAIVAGRAWTGDDAGQGAWDQPEGFRTLVHEWAHYALFLYDEYQDGPGDPAYCTRPDLRTHIGDPGTASIMAYHYTASELWQLGDSQTPDRVCENSDQFRVYHKTDWETMEQWYAIQGLAGVRELTPLAKPPARPEPKPEDATAWGPLVDVVGQSPVRSRVLIPSLWVPGLSPEPPHVTTETLRIKVDLGLGLALTDVASSQLYLLQGGGDPFVLNRILYQGNLRTSSERAPTILGESHLLGVLPSDRARVFVDRYTTPLVPGVSGGRFAFRGDEHPSNSVEARPDDWQASLDFVYTVERHPTGTGTLRALEVVVKSLNHLTELEDSPPVAMLCVPDATVGCHGSGWTRTMVSIGSGVYAATFAPAPGSTDLPLYGVLRVTAPGVGELMRWFRDEGGVGPAHMFGGAPLREGAAMVDTITEGVRTGRCNRVMTMAAADYAALEASLPKSMTLVSQPLDIDILLMEKETPCQGFAFSDMAVPETVAPLRLTLFYNQSDITRSGADEAALNVLHYSRKTASWIALGSPTSLDGDLNWVAAQIGEDGIYAVGAVMP